MLKIFSLALIIFFLKQYSYAGHEFDSDKYMIENSDDKAYQVRKKYCTPNAYAQKEIVEELADGTKIFVEKVYYNNAHENKISKITNEFDFNNLKKVRFNGARVIDEQSPLSFLFSYYCLQPIKHSSEKQIILNRKLKKIYKKIAKLNGLRSWKSKIGKEIYSKGKVYLPTDIEFMYFEAVFIEEFFANEKKKPKDKKKKVVEKPKNQNPKKADWHKFLLDKKIGNENNTYNSLIKKYNNYITDLYTDKSCKSLPMTVTYLIDFTDCVYRFTKKYMRRNDMYILSEVIDAEHDVYTDLFGRAKSIHLKWANGFLENSEKEISQFTSYWIEAYTEKNFYIKKVWKEYAEQEQIKITGILDDVIEDKKPKASPDDNKVVPAGSGSGFFVSSNGTIITNYHVIQDCKLNKIYHKDSQYEAKVLASDKVNDIAILKTNITPDRVFPVANEDVSLLEDVIVAGYPLGKQLSASIKTHKGVVTALAGVGDNFSNFQTDASINQGNSGGPILDQKGNVVGIAVATWVEEGVQGVHFGIKSSTLKTFASANGLKFLTPNNRDLSNKELGKLITESTVYVECHMTIANIKKMLAEMENKKAFFREHKK